MEKSWYYAEFLKMKSKYIFLVIETIFESQKINSQKKKKSQKFQKEKKKYLKVMFGKALKIRFFFNIYYFTKNKTTCMKKCHKP